MELFGVNLMQATGGQSFTTDMTPGAFLEMHRDTLVQVVYGFNTDGVTISGQEAHDVEAVRQTTRLDPNLFGLTEADQASISSYLGQIGDDAIRLGVATCLLAMSPSVAEEAPFPDTAIQALANPSAIVENPSQFLYDIVSLSRVKVHRSLISGDRKAISDLQVLNSGDSTRYQQVMSGLGLQIELWAIARQTNRDIHAQLTSESTLHDRNMVAADDKDLDNIRVLVVKNARNAAIMLFSLGFGVGLTRAAAIAMEKRFPTSGNN